MLAIAVMVVGSVGAAVAWRLVASGSVSVWVAQGAATAGAGVAAVVTGRAGLSQRVAWWWAIAAGALIGVALYAATLAFVRAAGGWTRFDRHVADIYDQRRGLSVPAAMAVASCVVAPGEELFWRGLFQARLAAALGWPAAALLTWGAYVGANLASASLPIVAAALVSGAVWGGLALWTHGVLASLVCHAAWTALMIALPPGPAGWSRGRPRG